MIIFDEKELNIISSLDNVLKEYIKYCVDLSIIDIDNKKEIIDKLLKVKIEYVTGKPYGGYTYNDGDKIVVEICKDTLIAEAKERNRNLDEYIDENIFHELVHATALNDIEIQNKILMVFPEFSFGFPANRAFSVINEYFAQRISQKLVEAKYENRYVGKKPFVMESKTFVYNENGQSSDNEEVKYDYVSDLDFYGELEIFATKLLKSLYGDLDIIDICKYYLSGDVLDRFIDIFRGYDNDIDKFYELLSYMGTIVFCDYFQQGYYGNVNLDSYKDILSKENFRECINNFNDLIDSLGTRKK